MHHVRQENLPLLVVRMSLLELNRATTGVSVFLFHCKPVLREARFGTGSAPAPL
jgi:hypothetical protein